MNLKALPSKDADILKNGGRGYIKRVGKARGDRLPKLATAQQPASVAGMAKNDALAVGD
jgi:hypothetical protein